MKTSHDLAFEEIAARIAAELEREGIPFAVSSDGQTSAEQPVVKTAVERFERKFAQRVAEAARAA